MQAKNYLANVREQYEDYPFPWVDPCNDKLRLFITPQDLLAKINHYCFQGKRDFSQSFRVLVAGGGTGQATIHLAEQLRDHPQSEIVYLDLSESSQAIAKQRANIRDLNNITWLHESILNIPELDLGKFDYINCTGVLHHLADPAAGLAALNSVLKDDGAMGLMVYAKYGRAGVYQIQALLKLINDKDAPAPNKVDIAKQAFDSLPDSHWQLRGKDHQAKKEFLELYQNDQINMYDTFLHEQDRAYSIPELYQWLDEQQLQLNAFTTFDYNITIPLLYQPETFIKPGALLEKIKNYDQRRQQAIAELLSTNLSLHTFYASKRDETIASIDDLDNVPFFLECHNTGSNIYSKYNGEEVYNFLKSNTPEYLSCTQPNNIAINIPVNRLTKYVMRHINGINSIGEIIELTEREANNQSKNEIHNELKMIYKHCHQFEWMMLRAKTTPAYKTYTAMQQPISERYKGGDHGS